MRRNRIYAVLPILLLALAGCSPELLPPDGNVLGLAVDWTGGDTGTTPDAAASADPVNSSAASNPLLNHSSTIQGTAAGTGSYQLFDLGPSQYGDEWTVSLDGSAGSGFIVVLFDADSDLLMRARVAARTPLRHVMRADTPNVRVGVMPVAGLSGGDFRYNVALGRSAAVPSTRPQVAYLDFGPGQNVKIRGRNAVSYAAFDAAVLGTPYVGQTQAVKDAIVASVREDYVPYEVTILTSDEGPPPTGVPYSTLYFGSSDSGLLGLADSVDMYNEELEQGAIIYVESFAPYITMQLEPDEMGVMIANVAGHELGHLLGLYHTKDPGELMDSTGTAWDLAGPQAFHRGSLEPTVFATGMENTPRLLVQTVGSSQKPLAGSAKLLNSAKMARYKQIRGFMDVEVSHKCGLCINPDE